MKKTLLAMVLAASMAPFTFAAQGTAAPAPNTKTAKKVKKHTKKAKKTAAETPAATAPAPKK